MVGREEWAEDGMIRKFRTLSHTPMDSLHRFFLMRFLFSALSYTCGTLLSHVANLRLLHSDIIMCRSGC